MLISSILDKILTFKSFHEIMTYPAIYFPIYNSLFKNIFGHNFFICQPIFKFFTAHIMKNLGVNIECNHFASYYKDTNFPRKFVLRSQF